MLSLFLPLRLYSQFLAVRDWFQFVNLLGYLLSCVFDFIFASLSGASENGRKRKKHLPALAERTVSALRARSAKELQLIQLANKAHLTQASKSAKIMHDRTTTTTLLYLLISHFPSLTHLFHSPTSWNYSPF
jgi:hypothetical protein